MSRFCTAAFALLSFTFLTQPSVAAELAAGTAPIYQAPVTTVTATRTAKDLRAIPAYTSVVAQDQLDEVQPSHFSNVLQKLANVDTAGGGRAETEQPIIRGLDDRRIVIKIDGQRNNFRGEYKGRYFIDPELVKQVDVVRGANSVVDGGGAIAGTVQFVTKDAKDMLRPGETSGIYMKGGYGTNGRQYQGSFAAYTGNDQADMLAAVVGSARNDISLGRDVSLAGSSSDKINSMFKGNVKLSEASKLTLAASNYFDRGDTYTNPLRNGGDAGFPAQREYSKNDVRMSFAYQPKDNPLWDLKAQAANSVAELTETVRPGTGVPGGSVNRKDLTDYISNVYDIQNTSRFEALDINHAVTFGVDGYHDAQKGRRPTGTRFLLLQPAEMYASGLFLQNEMEMGRLTITPGVRYDDYHLKGLARIGFVGSTLTFSENSDQQMTGKLAARYAVDDAWDLYASLAQAYRAPLLAEAFSGGSLGGPRALAANPNLQPEKGLNKEVGLGYQQKNMMQSGDRYTSRFTVFRNDVKDLIERRGSVDGNANHFQYVNVDEAYLQGFEWEQTYGAGAWEGSLALSYTDTNGKNRDSSVAAMNFSEPLVDVPPAKAVASVSYNFGLWDDGDARVTWQTEAALKQTEVSQNAKDTLLVREAPAYAVHNLYLNWQAGDYGYAKDVRVGLAAENLLDTAYRRQASFFNEEGRNLLVTVSSKF